MKKRIFAGLMCMMIVLSLCGCGEEPLPYNMKQIKKASFNEEFRLNHSTYGATCWKYRFTDDGHTISETWKDYESPLRRSVIIDNADDFNEAFYYYDQGEMPDFSMRMIAIIFFTGYWQEEYKVVRAKISDDTLYLDDITIERHSCNAGIGGLPPDTWKYVIVEMDQYYVTNVAWW